MRTLISPERGIVTQHKWKGRYNSQLAIGYTIPGAIAQHIAPNPRKATEPPMHSSKMVNPVLTDKP
ncbi:hypothetical protein [Bradyrhizobium sp. UFLA03-84]|uniref:hypothetical protein n=1 Tax=Bradyrhizobium sp. UFLA03-84 TaxID=418599 RepID=UPI0018E97778|nr:hypothetical protein [Bradyrhizobium sp. UFLA03-84]